MARRFRPTDYEVFVGTAQHKQLSQLATFESVDLKEAILAEHSRRQAEAITKAVIAKPDLMAELWQLFRTGEPPIPQRASYPIRVIWDTKPALLTPYLSEMARIFDKLEHNAERRTLAFILSDCDLPNDNLGTLVDACFGRMMDATEAVAVQVHCMTIVYNICKREPELKHELATVIEGMMEHATPGIASRGKKILKGLAKL